MSEPTPPLSSHALITDPRPWAFTRAELTAGLRRHTGDPSLRITKLEEREITQRRPAIGRLRGLKVETQGTTGDHTFNLVIKEPQGSTRAGMAGAGLREVSVYLVLGDHLPVRIPTLIAAHPKGDWLVFDQLPLGRISEKWQAADYLLATDQLVALHDRFWGLGDDLAVYTWLARPLDSDLNIHTQAAKTGADLLAQKETSGSLREDKELIKAIHTIIDHIDTVTNHLCGLPMTLLHGDYWPGNIHVHRNGSLTVYDWEMTAIGPGILDLLGFVQASTWWFSPLPIDSQEIIKYYRQRLAQSGTHTWKDKDWKADWDFAILWTFFSSWVDLLARIPKSILAARLMGLQNVLFNPVKEAIKRQLS
jgi:hypothetical protein